MKKLWKTLFVALLVVPLLTGVFGAKTVSADEEKPTTNVTDVNVTIHKRIWKDDNAPAEPIKNTGLEMSDFDSGEPLNGAGFTAYDVTDAYYSLLNGDDPYYKNSQERVIEGIANNASGYQTVVIGDGEQKTEGEGKTKGQTTFKGLPLKDGDGRDKVYMFVETSTPGNVSVTKKAAPIVLAMPIYMPKENDKDPDEINKDIQIYPKNETKTDKKEVDKDKSENIITVTDADGNVLYHNLAIGDEIVYKLTLNIPENIMEEGVIYSVTDTPSPGLAYVTNSFRATDLVEYENKTESVVGIVLNEEDGDYTLKEDKNTGGFTFTLGKNENVEKFAGSQLIVTYKMKLTAEVTPDKKEKNKAEVTLDGITQEKLEASPVGTGGYQFVKKDSQSDAPLSGAEFIVKQEKQDSNNQDSDKKEFDFATFEKGKNDKGEDIYLFKGWTTDKKDATRIVSDGNGKFKVIGLKNGTYQLEETKAPNKYALLDGDIEFIVQHGEYGNEELPVLNTPKGLLPATGGNGIYAFLLIGAVLMIGAYAWFKKSKTQAEV